MQLLDLDRFRVISNQFVLMTKKYIWNALLYVDCFLLPAVYSFVAGESRRCSHLEHPTAVSKQTAIGHKEHTIKPIRQCIPRILFVPLCHLSPLYLLRARTQISNLESKSCFQVTEFHKSNVLRKHLFSKWH